MDYVFTDEKSYKSYVYGTMAQTSMMLNSVDTGRSVIALYYYNRPI